MAPWSIMGIGALLGMSAAQGRTAERRNGGHGEAVPKPSLALDGLAMDGTMSRTAVFLVHFDAVCPDLLIFF